MGWSWGFVTGYFQHVQVLHGPNTDTSVGGGGVVYVATALTIGERSCDPLVLMMLGLEPDIEIPSNIYRLWLWDLFDMGLEL